MFTTQKGPLPTFFRYAPLLGLLALLALGSSTLAGILRDARRAPVYGLALLVAIPVALDLAWQAVKHYPQVRLDEDGIAVRVLGRFTQKVKWHNIQELIETESDGYAVLVSPHLRSPFLSSGLAVWERPFQPVIFLARGTPGADDIAKAIRARLGRSG